MRSIVFYTILTVFFYLSATYAADTPEQKDVNNLQDERSGHASVQAAIGSPDRSDFGHIARSNYPVLGDCYACTDCPIILPNITVKSCGYTGARCVVYTEKYNYLHKPIYIRGCVSERGTCEEIRKTHEDHQNVVKLLSCHECEGSRCNVSGVSRSLPDFTVAMFFIIVTPIVTKYAMS